MNDKHLFDSETKKFFKEHPDIETTSVTRCGDCGLYYKPSLGHKCKGKRKKKRAFFLGYSDHDCEAWYECPYCKKHFGSWSIFHNEKNVNGTRGYCPHCKEELEGLE